MICMSKQEDISGQDEKTGCLDLPAGSFITFCMMPICCSLSSFIFTRSPVLYAPWKHSDFILACESLKLSKIYVKYK